MKKTILVSLIVIAFSSPCLAQIEPEGIFGVENTLWEFGVAHIGFYAGKVYVLDAYGTCGRYLSSLYWDFIFFSVFEVTFTSQGVETVNGIVSSLLGIGFIALSNENIVLKKVSDSWYPSNCIDG